jgi:hypothetical protein
MNQLEKLIFLEITNKKFTKFPNSEYIKTHNLLLPEEQNKFSKYSQEIHQIWNYINSMPLKNIIDNKNVNSILDYNNLVASVSDLILKICNDFELSLKNEISPNFKENVIRKLGIDFYKKHFEK